MNTLFRSHARQAEQIRTGSLCFTVVALAARVFFMPQANAASTLPTADPPPSKPAEAIPWSDIGAKAGTAYKGDGLSVAPTESGARLRCLFQRLEGDATTEGFWLTSTVTNTVSERFRVVASSVGRRTAGMNGGNAEWHSAVSQVGNLLGLSVRMRLGMQKLPRTGRVTSDNQTVRFIRPGLVEEYSVSMDGLRQDFLIEQRPTGQGELRVELAVSGARVEPTAHGVQLVLEKSGRKLAYSGLRVSDANGRDLPARMELAWDADPFRSAGLQPAVSPNFIRQTSQRSGNRQHKVCATELLVLVDDSDAVYPIRIDPTFSDANWVSMGGVHGASGRVFAAAVDGSGNLYIGGDFTVVGDVPANRIAKWNGTNWSALGSGINSFVYALAISGSDLYAGGLFTSAGGSAANYIAKWNGNSWSALGSGMDRRVETLAVSGTDLYAGGVFTRATNSGAVTVTVNRIAKWDGSSWSALGSGINDGVLGGGVIALALSGSDLYAGGDFTTAGGSPAICIAKWNGSSWSALGSGMNNQVYALAVSGSDLYAGGEFTMAGGSAANYISKWNGSTWSALGSGMNSNVRALAVFGSDLYAGGGFTTATNSGAMTVPVNRIAKWNGNSWSALGLGMNAFVRTLAVSGSDLYAGGNFTAAGGSSANYIAKWNGSTWSATASGLNNAVRAMAVSGSDLYVGGDFTTAGGSPASYIAKWNGSTWTALGSGMNNAVNALAVAGSDLYAGGFFTTAGGSVANYIAKWNGGSWSALGSGMGGGGFAGTFLNALAVSGSNLYAGGNFTTAGGSPANYIAKWNGSTWTALGSGMSSRVYALAVAGSDLYAGGDFMAAGGGSANRIAKWNGSSWRALGSGMGRGDFPNAANIAVYALAVSGSDLYAGGNFATATNSGAMPVTVNYIAKWDGSSWTALGSGMNNSVLALAVSGSDLYAGGWFTMAGGNSANYIAKWNGSSWSALGSGMNQYGNVLALAVSSSDLYAGGQFTTAGGKVSPYVARAYLERPTLSILPSAADVTLSWPTFYETFLLQQNPNAANPDTWSTANYPLTTNGAIKSATAPISPTNLFFRLIGN